MCSAQARLASSITPAVSRAVTHPRWGCDVSPVLGAALALRTEGSRMWSEVLWSIGCSLHFSNVLERPRDVDSGRFRFAWTTRSGNAQEPCDTGSQGADHRCLKGTSDG